MNIKKRKKRISLSTKFNILTISLILVTSAGITLFIIRGEIRNAYKELLNHGQTIADIVSKNSEYGVYTKDWEFLEQIIEGLKVDPNIAYIAILDQERDQLVQKIFKSIIQLPPIHFSKVPTDPNWFSQKQFTNERGGMPYIDIQVPIIGHASNESSEIFLNKKNIYQQRTIGYVQLGLSQEVSRKHIRQFLLSTLLVTSVITLLGIVVTLLVTRRIISPIKRLKLATQEISDGKLDHRIEIETTDEISDLSESFNYMLKRLETYQDQVEERTADLTALNQQMHREISERKHAEEAIQKAHDELEVRVKERTSELLTTNEQLQKEIEERGRTEEVLRSERNKFRGMLSAIGDGVDIINKDYIIEFQNELLQTRFGDKQGENCYIAYMGLEKPCDFCRIQESIRTNNAVRVELVGRDGKNYELSSSPFIDVDGEVKVIELIREITEHKRAEEEMAALQEQLRQSQKMEAVGRLAGGIAHDFNNLLTVIQGYSQLSLMNLKDSDPLKGNIEEVKKASDRAAELTRQLLAFGRRQIMEIRVLDLNTVLQNLDKMLRRVIGEDIELVTLLSEDLGRVKTDPGQIEQVIMNLVVNARDAMPDGGKLTIETANVDLDEAYARRHVAVVPGQYVMLSVSDMGVGMAPEVKGRIFEPFFTTKEQGKGTGLGLSTVYGIVKQSGGNIWVYSEPGKGTAFKIYLPRVDEPIEEVKEDGVKEGLPRGSETILVVEDEEEVRKLVTRILRKQGYEVLETSNGDEALMVFKKWGRSVHLLMTDVVMPGMSGRALADRLASFQPKMKVLYMSGYTDNAIVHHGILGKGMKYIQKPFTVDGLAKKVREVLDKA
jgi:signal transduction histidine kinase/HAMP domain-containing protein